MDLKALQESFEELRTRTEEALGKLRRDEFLTGEETERLAAAARRLRELQETYSAEFGTEGQALFGSLKEIEKAVSDRESRLQAEKLARLKAALEEFLRLFSSDEDAVEHLAAAQDEARALLSSGEASADAAPYEVANRAAGEKEDSARKDIVKPNRKLLGEKFGAEFVNDLLLGFIQAAEQPAPEEEAVEQPVEEVVEEPVPEAAEQPVPEAVAEAPEEPETPAEVPEEAIEEPAPEAAEQPVPTEEPVEEPEPPEETAEEQDDGRAETLARQLIEAHTEPSETAPYLNLIDRLLAQGETAVASALAYALKRYGGQNEWAEPYANVEETLKYALGFGADGDLPKYDYAAICEHFRPEGEWQFAAKVCAYARALTQTNDAVDYDLLNKEAKPLLDKRSEWDGFEKWKQAFNALCDLLTDTPFAFSGKTLDKLEVKRDRANALKTCAEEARKLLGEFDAKSNAKRAREFMPLYRDFASKGKVRNLVKPIAEGKDEAGADVAAAHKFCAEFCDGDGNFLMRKAEEYAIAMGKENNLNEKLYGPIKESLLTLIEESVKLVGKWLSVVEGDAGGAIEHIEKERGRIAAFLKEAARPQNEPSAVLFKETAEDLSALLGGEKRPRRDFSAFLQTDVLTLVSTEDKGLLPEFPIFESKVTELGGYYRVLLHIAAKKDALDEETVQRRIEGDNLGMAQQICDRQQFKVTLPGDEFPKRDCETDYSKLKAYLDMGFMRGHIEALFQSISLKEMETVYKHCCKNKNYGLCKEFFAALKKAADGEKALRGEALKAEFETFAAERSKEEYPILTAISEQIGEENYAVAEVFLNQARRGEKAIDDSSLDEEDVHGQFLECCDTIYKFFKEYKWEPSTAQSLRQNEEKAAQAFGRRLERDDLKKAADMLERATMRGRDAWGKDLLKDLGFPVRERKGIVKKENGILLEHYEMTPRPNTLQTYEHPIGAFGTQLKDLMLLRIGNDKGQIADVLKQYANDLKGRSVVVFFDGEMTKPQRRKLAGQLKKDFSLQPYLVVDRVLCAFLAGGGGRLSATLKCTLPYTYLNPYCASGTGEIPSEMFFGRTDEKNMLLNMQNPSLVCGGRQLGKTALLKRAAGLAHAPNNQLLAVRCGKSKANRKEVLDELIKELAPLGLNTDGISGWETLQERIVEWHRSRAFERLIFFIDEADAFLAEDRADNYRALQCLTKAGTGTEHTFKFILAGLHNIARERHIDNSFALQLGEPCIVRPFTPREARSLVELPLLYLGFRFENEYLLPGILSHANYYPGLLHLFCYNLLTYLRENYSRYFEGQANPPFMIKEEHIGAILSDAAAEASGFNGAVKARFEATLDDDPRYRLLAIAMSILYREKKGQRGYSAGDVLEYVDLVLPERVKLEEHECENLLREMCDLGVLSIVKEEGSKVKFVFLRHVFDGYVSGDGGTNELYKLLETQAKEAFA